MIGELIGERYRLVEELERGQFIITYLAVDEALDMELEVDAVNVREAGCPVEMQRLEEILDAAMHVSGPHVFSLFGWGDEEGFIYLFRERVRGTPLAGLLAEVRELPRDQVAEITGAVTGVLAEAYGKGLFYLGLNPGQVMVDEDGGVKLVRVGFGWLVEEMEPPMAARVSSYRAPETDGGKEGARTSDVYSLAVMIREMLPQHEGTDRLLSLLERSMDPLPDRRPSSPRLLLEELEGAGDEGGGLEPESMMENKEEFTRSRSGGLGFLKRDADPSPALSLKKHPKRRMLRSLLMVLAGGMILWLGFAAVSGPLSGGGEELIPSGAGADEEKITLPDLRGLSAREAGEVLRDMGLEHTSREAPSRLWSAGRVAAQEPEKGSILEKGETVHLVISSGREEEPEGVTTTGDGDAGPPDAGGAGDDPPTSPISSGPPSSVDAPAPAEPLSPRSVPSLSARSGPAPLYVVMDGSGSYDPDGGIARYVWQCGDGTVLEGVTAQHVYDPAVIPVRFQVVLQVFDCDGLSHSSAVTVEVY